MFHVLVFAFALGGVFYPEISPDNYRPAAVLARARDYIAQHSCPSTPKTERPCQP